MRHDAGTLPAQLIQVIAKSAIRYFCTSTKNVPLTLNLASLGAVLQWLKTSRPPSCGCSFQKVAELLEEGKLVGTIF